MAIRRERRFETYFSKNKLFQFCVCLSSFPKALLTQNPCLSSSAARSHVPAKQNARPAFCTYGNPTHVPFPKQFPNKGCSCKIFFFLVVSKGSLGKKLHICLLCLSRAELCSSHSAAQVAAALTVQFCCCRLFFCQRIPHTSVRNSAGKLSKGKRNYFLDSPRAPASTLRRT